MRAHLACSAVWDRDVAGSERSERPSGNEQLAGGKLEPRGDRAAARTNPVSKTIKYFRDVAQLVCALTSQARRFGTGLSQVVSVANDRAAMNNLPGASWNREVTEPQREQILSVKQ